MDQFINHAMLSFIAGASCAAIVYGLIGLIRWRRNKRGDDK